MVLWVWLRFGLTDGAWAFGTLAGVSFWIVWLMLGWFELEVGFGA